MHCTNFGAWSEVSDNATLGSSYSVEEVLKRSLLLRDLRGPQKVAENYGGGCEDIGTRELQEAERGSTNHNWSADTTKNRKYIYQM